LSRPAPHCTSPGRVPPAPAPTAASCSARQHCACRCDPRFTHSFIGTSFPGPTARSRPHPSRTLLELVAQLFPYGYRSSEPDSSSLTLHSSRPSTPPCAAPLLEVSSSL